MSLTMRWSEAGYLSRIVLTHAPRQVSVSLILGVRRLRARMSNEGQRIFRVLALPAAENVLWVADHCSIAVGDYGWENDVSPSLIHLTGYSAAGGTVWYANFLPSEVQFVTLKPATYVPAKDTLYVTNPNDDTPNVA